jgi:membrane protease YdiL (CAAX protease family)
MQTRDVGPAPPTPWDWIFYNRKGIRSGWRLLAWFGLSVFGVVLVGFGLIAVVLKSGMALNSASAMPPWFLFCVFWLVFVPVYLASVVVAVVMERRPIGSLGLGFHSRWLPELGRGLAWGIGLMSVVMLVLVCTGAYRIHGFNEGVVPALGWGLLMAVGFVGVGLFEEFLMRGYLLQNLIDGLGLPAAAVISCLLFAALHIPNSGENVAGILDVLLAGILFVVLIVRTRSLWMAVGLHAAWDWAQNFLFSVADSGTVLPGGLLNTTSHGPAWLSGGAAGPEGSVVAFVIIGMAILYFARARWLVPSPDAALLWARFVSPRDDPVTPEFVPQVPPLPNVGFEKGAE